MVDDLIAGHGRFRLEYAADERAFLERLASDGQRPGALFVGCADSRVIPELLTGATPGQLFVVRNVANVIPPSGGAAVSVGAALEFAIGHLAVANLIVCGHDRCGGVEAILDGAPLDSGSDLAAWLAPVRPPVERARAAGTDRTTQLRRAVEENVLEQLANSLSYPVVQAARDGGRLDLHGWVYDIETFGLRVFDPQLDAFVSVAPSE
jgi:carbonic anhydrase